MKVENIKSYRNIQPSVRFKGSNVSVDTQQINNNDSKIRISSMPAYNNVGARKSYGSITFCGKDMVKGQVLSVVAEMPPYAKAGGVASVAESYNQLNGCDMDLRSVLPGYNAQLLYDENNEFTGEYKVPKANIGGKEEFVYTHHDLTKRTIQEIVDGGKLGKDYWILDEIKTKNIEIGLQKEVPVGVYQVRGAQHYMVYTPKTAAMPKPYVDGTYSYSSAASVPKVSTWKSTSYGEYQRALVSLLPDMVEAGVAPEKIILSDSQTGCIPELMAREIRNGSEYYKDVRSFFVSHNAGAGYVGYQDGRSFLVDIGTTAEEIERITRDPKYIEACESGKLAEYFKKIIPGGFDEASGSFSPSTLVMSHTEKGNLGGVATVSENYAKEICESDISPSLNKKFIELAKIKRARGILNPSEDPGLDPFSNKGLFQGYTSTIMVQDGKAITLDTEEVDGRTIYKQNGAVVDIADKQVFKPFRNFRMPTADAPLSYGEMIRTKAYNQARLMERLSNQGQKLPSLVLSGLNGKEVDLIGGIDSRFVQLADDFVNGVEGVKAPEMWCAWGRVDNQKGIPITLSAFEKFVKTTGNKNAVLVIGGPLSESGCVEEVKAVKDILERMSKDPELKGRFVFFDGFAPGKIFASASANGIFSSRFEPCGLTNVELMKYFGFPLVSNTGGFGQLADLGFGKATKHGWFLSKDVISDIRKGFIFSNPESAQKIFEKFGILTEEQYKTADEATRQCSDSMKGIFETFGTKCKQFYDKTLEEFQHRVFKDKKPSEKVLSKKAQKALYKSEFYKKLESQLRDSILVEEFTRLMTETTNLSEDAKAKIFEHIKKLDMTWKGSAKVHADGRSTLEHYKEFLDGGIIDDKYTITDFDKIEKPVASYSNAHASSGTADNVSKLFKKTKLGWILGGVAAAYVGSVFAYKKFKSNKIANTPLVMQQTPLPVSARPMAAAPVNNRVNANAFFAPLGK